MVEEGLGGKWFIYSQLVAVDLLVDDSGGLPVGDGVQSV